MKPIDSQSKAFLTSMWAGIVLTGVIIFFHHGFSAGFAFGVAVLITYWMGCQRTKRPWEQWRRQLADRYERALIRVKRDSDKLHEGHSITKFDGLEKNAARQDVLIDVMEQVAPERRLPL